jgi:hypothetical protein
MTLKKLLITGLLFCWMIPGSAFAVNTVLSDIFDGSEAKIAPLPGTCEGPDPLGYQVVDTVTINTAGDYVITDLYNVFGADVSALLYQGSFNPNNPSANLVTQDGIDISDVFFLPGGDYILVVQHWCENAEGAWAVSFSGPGAVTSPAAVSIPADTTGTFTTSDPSAQTECGDTEYQVSGPIQVSVTGTYYYTDAFWLVAGDEYADMCLQIYSAPFDPANPNANRVGNGVNDYSLDDYGTFELEAGQDYYLVAQPLFALNANQESEFFFVLAPPAPMRINKALAGSWFYPPTRGQGFLIDVFETNNLMYLAWFTYDLERPDPDVTAMIGDPGHRWITALGPFDGATAELDIYWNSGMIFDSEAPPVTEEGIDGSMTVNFTDCKAGTVEYDLGTRNRTGVVPIEPILYDHVELCESMNEAPGKPGPL